jgi:hypothetical protein
VRSCIKLKLSDFSFLNKFNTPIISPFNLKKIGEETTFVLISEYDFSLISNGTTRRMQHLSEWLQTEHETFETHIINQNFSGKVRRIINAVLFFNRINSGSGQHYNQKFLINGLAAPHMFFLSRIFLSRNQVIFDICDSLRGQFINQLKRFDLLRALSIIFVGLAMKFSKDSVSFSYISEKDLAEDRFFLKGKNAITIYPKLPKDLQSEDLFETGLATRVVLFHSSQSVHTQKYTKVFLNEVPRILTIQPNIELDIFTSSALKKGFPKGVNVHSGIFNYKEIYNGQTLIFISNDTSTGISNKLLEAVYLQKPIIVHTSLASQLKEHPWIMTFSSRAELRKVLQFAVSHIWIRDDSNPIQFLDPKLNVVLNEH